MMQQRILSCLRRGAKSLKTAASALALLLAAVPAVAGLKPGLQYGEILNMYNIVDGVYPAVTNTALTTLHGSAKLPWTTALYIYWGQIYLDGSTYRFGENIDDQAKLTIDGEVILDNKQWGVPTFGSITRPAGWYDFEVRFQNVGGGGPVVNPEFGFTRENGFSYTKGTEAEVGALNNATTFVPPVDPGDGTFFRYDDGKRSGVSLTIVGTPENLGVVEPPYGIVDELEAGQAFACDAPGKLSLDGTIYTLAGYKLYDLVGEKLERGDVVSQGAGNHLDYLHGTTDRELEWSWKLSGYVVSITNSPHGSVSTYGGVLEPGSTVTVTATADEGYEFFRWSGDVAEGDSRNPVLTLTADRPLVLRASFLQAAGANTFYVDPAGNDENTGVTPDSPFLSIGAAVRVAAAGDRIVLSEGTHLLAETVLVDKELTITGAGMDRTIVDRASDEMKTRFFILNHPKAVLEDVTLRNARHIGKYDDRGNAVLIDEKGGVFRDSRVTACQSGTFYRFGTVAIRGVEGLVSRCIINNNTNFGGNAGYGGGLYVEKGLAENCLVYGNYATLGGGVRVSGGGMVRNCTIVGNTAYDRGGGLYWEGDPKDPAAFQNNLVAWNDSIASPGPGGDEWYAVDDWHENRLGQIAANCFFGPSARPIGENSLSGDPCLADWAAGDFSLLTGSPAMDAGAPYEGIAGTDLAGNARSIGGAPDIGCLEFAGESLSCGFTVTPAACFEGEAVSLRAVVRNAAEGESFTYDWVLKSAEGETLSFSGEAPTEAIAKAGRYDVTLTVSDGTGARATLSRPAPLHVAARTNYLALAGTSTPVYPWKTPATAGNDLAAIVAEAIDGSVILLGEGEFPLPAEIVVLRAIKLIGAGIDKTVFTRADPRKSMRLFQLGDSGVLLEGVTLKGGRYQGSYDDYGNGILINARGGTFRQSRVTECTEGSLYHRGAVAIRSAAGLVSHCVIDHNSCKTGRGGGIWVEGGLLENSLVYANEAAHGGGLWVAKGGRIRSCTIADNLSTGEGGGVYWEGGEHNQPEGCFVDVIVAGNEALNDPGKGKPEWYVANDWHLERFAKTTGRSLFGFASASVGTNSLLGDPVFSDVPGGDFTLLTGSPAIDAGMDYEGISGTDLAGDKRVQGDKVDIGCYEFAADQLTCGFSVVPTVLFEGEKATFTPTVFGAPDPAALAYRWTLTSKLGKVQTFEGDLPVEALPDAGWYDVLLEVTDVANGLHATLTRPNLIHVAAREVYLAPTGTPAYPWKTPETAATNIQDLVTEAIDGVTVRMAAGEYGLTNQVDIAKGIKLLGAGIDKTVFVPATPETHIRFFYVNHPDALLDGVTLKGACHSKEYSDHGNALLIGAMGGTFSRSRVTEGRAYSLYHRGMVGVRGERGLVSRCVIDHNVNADGNAQAHGNGLALTAGVAENCLVYENEAEAYTAGLILEGPATVRNCTFADNRLLVGPEKEKGAAGVYLGWNGGKARVVNCVFAGNETSEERAAGPGAPEWAVMEPAMTNCFVNCLFSDSIPTGTGAVEGDPLFKDPAKGDYSIPRKSPAHDAGLFEDWMADAVDLAGAPRVDHKELVDLGCYEAPYAPGATMLMLR